MNISIIYTAATTLERLVLDFTGVTMRNAEYSRISQNPNQKFDENPLQVLALITIIHALYLAVYSSCILYFIYTRRRVCAGRDVYIYIYTYLMETSGNFVR